MSDNKEKRPIDLELMCELSDEELQHRAQQLGAAVVEQDEIDSRKKDAMKAFGDEAKEVAQRMRLLSRAIRSRKERRLVGCVIEFHTPTQATKRTTRLDTGEVVSEQAMSSEECQDHLFDTEPEPAAEAQELPLGDGEAEVGEQDDADGEPCADCGAVITEHPDDHEWRPRTEADLAAEIDERFAVPAGVAALIAPGEGVAERLDRLDADRTQIADTFRSMVEQPDYVVDDAGGVRVDETPAAEPAADPETPARKGRRRR